MKIHTQLYRLAQALANHIEGKATPEEEELVGEWLTGSPENRLLLDKLSNKEYIDNKYIAQQLCDTSAAYERFLRRQKRYRRRLRTIYAVSGATGVILLFWFGATYFSPSSRNDDLISQIIPVDSSNAILLLGDGRQIVLGEERRDTIFSGTSASIMIEEDRLKYDEIGTLDDNVLHDRIFIPVKEEYRITLSDGTKVHLNSESELSFPAKFSKNERRVTLKGEAFFEVSPDPDKPFIVESNGLGVRVTGTSFNVRAYPDEPYIYTTLVSGGVELENESGKAILAPGQQGYAEPCSGTIFIRDVDVRFYTAWTEGCFIFENQPLEEIMRVLKRWYGFEVVFENEAAKKVKFYGNIERKDDLSNTLEKFSMTSEVKFRREGTILYIL